MKFRSMNNCEVCFDLVFKARGGAETSKIINFHIVFKGFLTLGLFLLSFDFDVGNGYQRHPKTSKNRFRRPCREVFEKSCLSISIFDLKVPSKGYQNRGPRKFFPLLKISRRQDGPKILQDSPKTPSGPFWGRFPDLLGRFYLLFLQF